MRRLSPNTKKGFMLIEVLVVVLIIGILTAFAQYLNLCYLSPKIVADILEYRNPRNMSLKELMNLASQAVNFEKQENVWRAE